MKKDFMNQNHSEVVVWAEDRGYRILNPKEWAEMARLKYDQAQQKKLLVLRTEDVKSLLTCALEGGSNYWYDFGNKSCDRVDNATLDMADSPFVDRLYTALERGQEVVVYDANEPVGKRKRLGTLTEFSWRRAEKLMIEGNDNMRRHLGDVLSGNEDATTGDVFFQLALMGEVVYG